MSAIGKQLKKQFWSVEVIRSPGGVLYTSEGRLDLSTGFILTPTGRVSCHMSFVVKHGFAWSCKISYEITNRFTRGRKKEL